MTKTQTWNEAQTILKDLGLYSNETVLNRFRDLLEPKKSGGTTKRSAIIHNDEPHYYCRFTGEYFPKAEMVYQNDEKREKNEDKGYSNIGISLWNKGQKDIKDIMKLATEINFGIITELEIDGEDGVEVLHNDELKAWAMKSYQDLEANKKENNFNKFEYLMAEYLTDEQADKMEGLDLPAS